MPVAVVSADRNYCRRRSNCFYKRIARRRARAVVRHFQYIGAEPRALAAWPSWVASHAAELAAGRVFRLEELPAELRPPG